MVSSCKICGERTARNRQYCPYHRRTHKGLRRDPIMRELASPIIAALPLIILSIGLYRISLGAHSEGTLFLILGVMVLYGMVSSERSRKLLENRIFLSRRHEKSLEGLNNKPDKKGFYLTGMFILTMALFLVVGQYYPQKDNMVGEKEMISKDILDINEQTISPEEELTNFCISQFSNAGIFDLKKIDYQNDFSSASDWIRDNYENSALTQEQKEHNINYIIENQLPREDYPILIISGSKKEGQVTSQGFYYCNEKGVI